MVPSSVDVETSPVESSRLTDTDVHLARVRPPSPMSVSRTPQGVTRVET